MDMHIKHKVLIICVIIGLVILLLPLFQSSKELLSSAPSYVKAPPFPDQTTSSNH